jgi:hypothetical protein
MIERITPQQSGMFNVYVSKDDNIEGNTSNSRSKKIKVVPSCLTEWNVIVGILDGIRHLLARFDDVVLGGT